MESRERIMGGDLETLGLPSTLKMLALGGKTGILHIQSGLEQLDITLQNGHIVALEEPHIPPPDLIEVFRLLDRIDLPTAHKLRQVAGYNPATLLPMMCQWGYLTAEEAHHYVETQVILALSRAVRWERGHFEFHRDIAPIQARVGFSKPLNVDHVLLDALRMADEREHCGVTGFSRHTLARWMPQFQGDVRQLGLNSDEVQTLCLSNGQLTLYAVAYGLRLPEARIAIILQKLLDLGLIELVDPNLEGELEHSLVNLLTHSQHQLTSGSQRNRATTDQGMLTLVSTMGGCINGLLAHHAIFARAIRGRGELPPHEIARQVELTVRPLLDHVQHEYPRMDGILRLTNGVLDIQDVETLHKVVRGQELMECYWDAVRFLSQLMRMVFERVLADEVGKSRMGRQYEDLWAAFLREIDDEIRRLSGRFAPLRV
ncbi:MAG: DUF4388 domain-containing protein [Ktedonobacterales bacterium]